MRKLFLAVAIALSTTACADAAAGGADVYAPTAVAELATLGAATDSSGTADDECPASVTVKRVPPVRGVGYTWVRAAYEGGDTAVAPTWTISEGADIRAYSEDEFHAYVMAPTGTYTVRATGPCGVFGEVKIDHVITLP